MNQDNMLPFWNDKKLIYIQQSENSLNFLTKNTLDKCIQSEDEFFSFFLWCNLLILISILHDQVLSAHT